MVRTAPDGFEYELDSSGRRVSSGKNQYWLVCLQCDRHIMGSGLGVGAHRRWCHQYIL